jgi:hypothetical protein
MICFRDWKESINVLGPKFAHLADMVRDPDDGDEDKAPDEDSDAQQRPGSQRGHK